MLSVVSLITVVRLYRGGRSVAVNAGESTEGNKEKVCAEKEINDLKKELGFLYFLEQKDYRKSEKYFSEARNEKEAEYMAELAGYMSCSDFPGKEGMIRELLEKMTKEVVPDRKETEYYRCLIEGYRLLEGKDAAKEVIRLGELCMDTAGAQVQQELREAMAYAWETLENPVKAIELYEEMVEQEDDSGVREALYKKLVVLWKEEGDLSEAANVCREGIEELEESVELRMMHIEMQCADASIEREVCARTIQKYREEIPEIIENQEFKKLAKEYDIQMEGESVWVGR